MGTKIFIAIGVLHVELIVYLKFQWFLLQIDCDSSIYILDVIFG